jgi:hypothetical protein
LLRTERGLYKPIPLVAFTCKDRIKIGGKKEKLATAGLIILILAIAE